MRKLFIFILLAWVFILSASADLSIIVRPNESWKNMQTNEIETLCTNVALHFQEQLRDEHKIKGKKLIIDFGGPQILLKSWEPETHYIFLSVNGAYWQQLTYQFAHEFCHVLHKHENFGIGHPNKWFYESISMAASLWALREMEKTWEYRPPYPNWAGWRQNLGEYADQNKNRDGVQYSGTAPEWLKKWEIFLRDDSKNTFTHHLLVAQLSFKFFLPIFEKNPEVWNAVAQMPTSRSEISQYMKEWYDTVDPQDKRVVQAMAEVMGIDVDSPIPIVDVMNSGLPLTFTHAANALVPINGIDEWDGWTQGIWEKRPDGTTTRKSGAYFDFPEMDRWEHWMY